jgi:chemotaxis protein MotA
MDLATLFGLIFGVAIIAMAMVSGSEFGIFVNVPGILIVLGGTLAATLIKFPIVASIHAFGQALRQAFGDKAEKPYEIIKVANELADLVRKKNLLALQDANVKDPLFQKGLQLCVDGHKPEFVGRVLMEEMNHALERHEMGEQIFRAIGESAPAFGMIGTLVGLVQMLSGLSDPAAIGPAMAVALLTTLYGALIANLIALPIADKLGARCQQERINKSIILESVLSIQRGENPRVMDELLEAFLPTAMRKVLNTRRAQKQADTAPPTAATTAGEKA